MSINTRAWLKKNKLVQCRQPEVFGAAVLRDRAGGELPRPEEEAVPANTKRRMDRFMARLVADSIYCCFAGSVSLGRCIADPSCPARTCCPEALPASGGEEMETEMLR